MDQFFDTRARKVFFATWLVMLLLLFLAGRFLLIPYLESGVFLTRPITFEISKAVLDNVIAAIITTGVITTWIILLSSPKKKLAAMVENVAPAETNSLHEQVLKTSSE